jgi:hypothetical protein
MNWSFYPLRAVKSYVSQGSNCVSYFDIEFRSPNGKEIYMKRELVGQVSVDSGTITLTDAISLSTKEMVDLKQDAGKSMAAGERTPKTGSLCM